MVCCKLDKIDKIFISLLCIFVTFTCIINTFCYGAEVEAVGTLTTGFYLNAKGQLIESIDSVGVYYDININEKYLVINNKSSNNVRVCFTKEIPNINSQVYEVVEIPPQTTKSIDVKTDIYRYLFLSSNTNLNSIQVFKSDIVGYDSVINLLVSNAGSNLWNIFNNLLPFVLVVVTVSLGFYFILHAIKEVSKGRDV